MFKRTIIALLMLLVVARPAQAAHVFIPIFVPNIQYVPGARTADYNKIHTVAIISAIGLTMRLQNNHFLSSKAKQQAIQDWKIDQAISDGIRKDLGARFAFGNVQYDAAALAGIPNGPLNASKAALIKFLGALPANGIDAFLVLRPDLEYNTPGFSGLALDTGNGISDPESILWANYEIDLVDARTLQVIAQAYSRIQSSSDLQPTFAGMLVDRDLNLTDELNLTDQQVFKLRADTSALLSMSLLETLRALNLGVDLPPIGSHPLNGISQEADPFAAIKSVGIISAIGDSLELEHLGGTIFSETNVHIPIADWRLDNEIEAMVKAHIGSRFEVREVRQDRDALSKVRLNEDDTSFRNAIETLKPDMGVDAYLILVKQSQKLGYTVINGDGVGLWNHSAIFNENTEIFAHYAVALVDAHTLKMLEARVGILSPTSIRPSPTRDVRNQLWHDASKGMTPEIEGEIKPTLKTLLDESLAETLLRMGLAGTGTPSEVTSNRN